MSDPLINSSSAAQEATDAEQMDQWQQLLVQQDDLVAAVLMEKMELEDTIAEEQARLAQLSEKEQESSLDSVIRLEQQLRELETQLEKDREAYLDLNSKKETSENVLSHLDSKIAETQQRIKEPESRPSLPKTVLPEGPKTTIVLINGSTAPFADELIRLGQEGGRKAAKLLRENLLPKEPSAEAVVFTQLWYDRKELITSLQQHRVISAPSTWNGFLTGLCREPLRGSNSLTIACELDAGLIEQHAAATLVRMGHLNGIERVVFVGMHPETAILRGLTTLEDADGSVGEAFLQVILPKAEIIDHMLGIDKPDFDFATIEIPGLFGSSISKPFPIALSPSAQIHVPAAPVPVETSAPQPAPTPTPTPSGSASSASIVPVEDAASVSWMMPDHGRNATGQRHVIDPNRGFLNQDSLLCYYFYLDQRSGCTNRKCTRSHDYQLNERQVEHFRRDVKRLPCRVLLKSGKCPNSANTCLFSHNIPRRE